MARGDLAGIGQDNVYYTETREESQRALARGMRSRYVISSSDVEWLRRVVGAVRRSNRAIMVLVAREPLALLAGGYFYVGVLPRERAFGNPARSSRQETSG